MKNMLEGPALMKSGALRMDRVSADVNNAVMSTMRTMGDAAKTEIGGHLLNYMRHMGMGGGFGVLSENDIANARAVIQKSILSPMNAFARNMRSSWYDRQFLAKNDLTDEAIMKAQLDVNTLTNFANITGGQALGYVSMDTRMARSTIRPNSFTLYQCLDKSLAWQVVDYWSQATDTGGAAPGSAFSTFSSVNSGALATNAGVYELSNVILKLALDGRSITTALAAQNSFVNIQEQETVNAALSILASLDWACYWGDSTQYPSQFEGVFQSIAANAPGNIFDYYAFSNANSSRNWSPEQTLYNLIYEGAAQITSYGVFGHITHAFMSPTAMGSFQQVTNAVLNNILNQLSEMQDRNPIIINGNLVGMQTRVGNIQFPQDLLIDARNMPLQAINSTLATTSAPTKPATVTGAVTTTGATIVGSNFNGDYTPSGGGSYMYAVASTSDSFAESTLTYSAVVSGVAAGNAVTLTIAPPGANDATGFRVYRSGIGYNAGTPAPSAFRFIGYMRANGSSNVSFVDLNGGVNSGNNGGNYTFIPGSTSIFLLDLDEQDFALDFRVLLPMVKVELFAANLFMPWAVASISSIRPRIPKFHGIIMNYVPSNPLWNPLSSNM